MDQISINLDLVNQNKELLLNNINITNQLNQQIINNTALLLENQNLIKEKVQLNDKLDESTEKNNELNKKVEKLENDSYWYIIFIFISIKISYDKLCTKQQHIIIYMSHFFYNK